MFAIFFSMCLFKTWFFSSSPIFNFRCKKHNVPIEKIFNKTQRDKFRWAIEMVDEDYVF